jgi:hypothetical protein
VPYRFGIKQDGRSGDPRSACCAAQMFLDSGDGVVFKGGVEPWYSPRRGEFHLGRQAARGCGEGRAIFNNAIEWRIKNSGHCAVQHRPSDFLPQNLNRHLNCTALLSVNLPGFLNNLERRLGELVPLGEIAACVLELVEAAGLTFRLCRNPSTQRCPAVNLRLEFDCFWTVRKPFQNVVFRNCINIGSLHRESQR